MNATENCIICYEEATCYGGHVHIGNSSIVAGFCQAHFDRRPELLSNRNGCKGCYGKWTAPMGMDYSFGQLMYIDKDGLHLIERADEKDV